MEQTGHIIPTLEQSLRTHHILTLPEEKFIRRYHLIAFGVGCFVIGIVIVGTQFTVAVITARIVDGLGDVFLDRGFGDL